MNEIKVDVRVSRVQSSNSGEWVSLRITDQASGVEFIDVRMSMAQFGNVLSGGGLFSDPATAEVGGLQYIGKRHEHQSKTFAGGKDFGQAEADAWADAMLADGWDTKSTHRNNRAQTVAIVRRYV